MLILSVALLGTCDEVIAFYLAGTAMKRLAARQTVDQLGLPAELVVPPVLPAGLDDPTLLEAWIRLYSHTEPVELWDGTTLTGRDLAQFLLDQSIPLVWDVQGVCRHGTCSRQYCAGEICAYEDGQPGMDPIYIYPPHAADMPTLVATLAHESFHRRQPFGPVRDTRFEEFWACKIGSAFGAENGFKFDGYDPLVAGYLLLWIRDNGLAPYYALPDYPPSIIAELANAAAP